MSKERTGSIVEKNGKLYVRINYQSKNGKRRELMRRVANRKEGHKVRKQLLEELDKPNAEMLIDGAKMTFLELAQHYQEHRLVPPEYVGERKVRGLKSWKVLRGYLVPLLLEFSNQKIVEINYRDLEEYKFTRLKTPKKLGGGKRSIANVNREMELMRAMYIYARDEGWIERTPFTKRGLISKADEKFRTRVLTLSEAETLIEACRKGKRRNHIAPLVICALYTGMRKGELFKMVWNDVNIERRIITVRALNTKTQTERLVPIADRVANELVKLRANAAGEDRIFPMVGTQKSFNSACAEAGLVGLRFHDLRATAGSWLIEGGMPIEQVAKILGHTNYQTTFRHYNRITEITVNKAAEVLNGMRRTGDEGDLADLRETLEKTSILNRLSHKVDDLRETLEKTSILNRLSTEPDSVS